MSSWQAHHPPPPLSAFPTGRGWPGAPIPISLSVLRLCSSPHPRARLPDSRSLFPQGVLPTGTEEDCTGLLHLHAVLRHHCLHHREHASPGGRGGHAGEQRRECLQHRPQHLPVRKPAVRQPDPEGRTVAAHPADNGQGHRSNGGADRAVFCPFSGGPQWGVYT